jgi:hypothetical protein
MPGECRTLPALSTNKFLSSTPDRPSVIIGLNQQEMSAISNPFSIIDRMKIS